MKIYPFTFKHDNADTDVKAIGPAPNLVVEVGDEQEPLNISTDVFEEN